MIKEFFKKDKHKFYPFSNISIEKWGLDLLPEGKENV